MKILDHGVFSPYVPPSPEVFSGRAAIYLKNPAGIDWYDLVKAIKPGASLAELDPASGIVLGFTGMDGEPIDYTTRFPENRRLIEIRPARTDLRGLRWDGSALVARPAPVFTKLAKSEFWRRLTDEEASAVDQGLQSAPLRLRRIFEAAQHLDTEAPDFPDLRSRIVAALGESRAAQVLTPSI